MRGKTVDRAPVGFYTHFPDRRDNTVAGQAVWTFAYAMDYICIETDGYMQVRSQRQTHRRNSFPRFRKR